MNKERIAYYLAQNLLPSAVASIVGVTPSYISQLLKEVDFKLLIEQERAKSVEESTEDTLLDSKYLGIEHKLLQTIEGQMGMASLSDLTRTLDVICRRQDQRAKQKAPIAPTPVGTVNQQFITNLILPGHAIPQQRQVAIEMNSEAEVIAIEGQPLAPMASASVQTLFQQMKEKRDADRIQQKAVAMVSAHRNAMAIVEREF